MNPRIKQLWLDALRSGDYAQGTGKLKTSKPPAAGKSDMYCCLGVLCDLHAKETGTEWNDARMPDPCSYQGHELLLPQTVSEWAELGDNGSQSQNDIDPIEYDVRYGGSCYSLSQYNDNGASFDDIAAVIEKHL
jgi:hypothetical protein